MGNRITLNIPHSSINGLSEADWNSQIELVTCVNELTDWHTDIMFTPDRGLFNKEDVRSFVFHKSRFVVDAERLIDDDMENIGQGIVYTDFYGRIQRNVNKEEKDALYKEREEYLSKIEQNIISNDRDGYGNVLIDCHSFPSRMGDMDICVGYNEDASKPSDEVINRIINFFEEAGLSVGINTPFSNSLQPVKDLSLLHHDYFSFMIELNKKIYLNEENRRLIPNFSDVKATLAHLYEYLLNL